MSESTSTAVQPVNPISIIDDAIDKEIASYISRAIKIVNEFSEFHDVSNDVFVRCVMKVATMIRDEMAS